MMGEYIIYNHNQIIGGIYDDRFLVKSAKIAFEMMPNVIMELPCEVAKKCFLLIALKIKNF